MCHMAKLVFNGTVNILCDCQYNHFMARCAKRSAEFSAGMAYRLKSVPYTKDGIRETGQSPGSIFAFTKDGQINLGTGIAVPERDGYLVVIVADATTPGIEVYRRLYVLQYVLLTSHNLSPF